MYYYVKYKFTNIINVILSLVLILHHKHRKWDM